MSGLVTRGIPLAMMNSATSASPIKIARSGRGESGGLSNVGISSLEVRHSSGAFATDQRSFPPEAILGLCDRSRCRTLINATLRQQRPNNSRHLVRQRDRDDLERLTCDQAGDPIRELQPSLALLEDRGRADDQQRSELRVPLLGNRP